MHSHWFAAFAEQISPSGHGPPHCPLAGSTAHGGGPQVHWWVCASRWQVPPPAVAVQVPLQAPFNGSWRHGAGSQMHGLFGSAVLGTQVSSGFGQ